MARWRDTPVNKPESVPERSGSLVGETGQQTMITQCGASRMS